MVDVAELNLRVQSDDVLKADQRLGRFSQSAQRADRVAEKFASNAARIGRGLSVGLTLPLVAAATASARLAIDAEEVANKFNVVFGPSTDRIRGQLQELTKTIPQTRTQLEGLAAGVQDLLVPLGLARDEAADLSATAVELAGDLASFNNVGADRVLEALKSALAGSSEPMRRFGVDTRETRLQTLALNRGLIEQGEELDGASRAQAVFAAITADSTDAIGDAARTVDSAANQIRFLQREVRQLSEDLGKELIPFVRDAVGGIRGFVAELNAMDPATRRASIGAAAVVAALGPLLIILGAITNALRTLIPLMIGRAGLAGAAIILGAALGNLINQRLQPTIEAMRGLRGELDNLSPAADRFTLSVAAMRDEFLRLQLDQARSELEDMSDAAGQFGDAIRRDLVARINDLNREIEINQNRLEAHKSRLEDSGVEVKSLGEFVGDLSTNLAQMAMEMAASVEATEKVGGTAEDAAEEVADLSDAMADLAAQLRGPLAQAQREFQTGAQAIGEAFRTQQISGEEAAELLDLLETQYQRTGDAIRNDFLRSIEDALSSGLPEFIQQMLGLANATNQAAGGFLNFGRIGSGFAQSVFNGQGVQDSISSALIGAGGQGLSDSFGQIFEDGFKSALDNLGDPETWKPSAEGFALALGQAASGNIGQAAFTAVGNAIGGPIGALIGSIIGDAVFGESTPKFQVRGVNSNTATDAGTDRVIGTAFGADLEIAFRGIEDQAKSQIIRGYSEFLSALSGVVRDPNQQSAIADVISRFGVSSRSGPDDIEGQLNLLFDDILGTFDGFTQNFVNMAETLEARVQRLSEVFFVQNQLLLGRGFGLSGAGSVVNPGFGGGGGGGQPGVPVDPGFGGGGISPDPILRPRAEQMAAFTATIEGTGDAAEVTNPVLQQTLTLLDELRIGSESLQDTFVRLSTVVDGLDRAAGLTGNAFAESREDLVRFGAELVSIFGDDAGQFNDILNRVLQAAFSDDELARQTIDAARQRATDLLTQLGITVSEETFTQEGLRDLIDNFLGNLNAEDTAQLLAAGDAIAALIEAQNSLTDSTEELTEATVTLEEQQNFLRDVGRQALQVVAPARAEFARLTSQLAENERQAQELGLSEEQLNIVRLSSQVQLQGFIAALSESIPDLADRLFGAGEASVEAGEQIAQGVRNTRDAWLSAIDRIRDALDSQLTGPNSSLTNAERLAEAERQLQEASAAARGGDLGAAQQLGSLFNQLIAQGAGAFGTSSERFAALEARARGLLEGVATGASIPPEVSTAQNTAQTAAAAEGIELSALQQVQLATQLIDQIGLLSQITGQNPSEIGAQFGVPIAELIRILTGEVPDLTGDALAGFFDTLVSETNAQLNELAALEQINIDQFAELNLIRRIAQEQLNLFQGFEAGGKFEQFAGPPGQSVQTDGFGNSIVSAPMVEQKQSDIVAELRSVKEELRQIREFTGQGNADRRSGLQALTELTEEQVEALLSDLRIRRQGSTARDDRRNILR